MANLPDDVITNILLRLPAKSLVQFRCVCRSWKSLISGLSFVRSYLDRSFRYGENVLLKYTINGSLGLGVWPPGRHELSSVDPPIQPALDRFQLNGSCNGVICLTTLSRINPDTSKIYLWNPSINELRVVPESHFHVSNLVGFGCDPSSGHPHDFKVVNFKTQLNFKDILFLPSPTEVEIYSLRKNTWKQIGSIFASGVPKYMGRQVLFREFICWCSYAYTGNLKTWSLVLFDVINEVFDEKATPESLLCIEQYVTTLEGCLSILAYNDSNEFEVWIMKEFGDAESWTKLYTIEIPQKLERYIPLGFTGKDEVLFAKIHKLSHGKDRTILALYNMRSMAFQGSHLCVDSFSSCCMVSYAESLVSVMPGNAVPSRPLSKSSGNWYRSTS
ncbi:hypothetical protein BT93_L0809 [Corymbia citriodora subsp. variegata]|uniref:F-box domain-containing protein n=1 Tax=Corymbia citriodora subsp. variegata TaxID=360336 RepID=A0A8T0CT15_CORYI|nr:hypothetical protein BT93_L0809 [Corymbia citriodora subsp. variegata]